jgi:indolepyruvate ferredoxin oxidoreductase
MDKRFLKSEGLEAFTGNELLLKGSLEGGINLLTGYPGSPVSDIFESATDLAAFLKEHGILAQLANNEAMAAARLNGSQLQDLRAMAVMKSVGLHVAADGLATGNMGKTGHKGGALAVVGDDPWSDSTQVPIDSRRLSDHLLMPVMEPATFQEVKDWIRLGFELSAASDLYITYLITTNQADGGGTVQTHPFLERPGVPGTNHKVDIDSSAIQVDHSILLPPHTARLEHEAYAEKLPALLKAIRAMGLNRLETGKAGQHLGFITAGLSYTYLRQALRDCGLEGAFPILKLGISYPVDKEALREMLGHCSTLLVVEEKRGFIEGQVRAKVLELKQNGEIPFMPEVWGKEFPQSLPGFPMEHGLNPGVILKRLVPLFDKLGLATPEAHQALDLVQRADASPVRVPARTPTFCPGCPHRDSSSVFLELSRDFKNPVYMRRVHDESPKDILFHGDAGCYSMLYFPPNEGLMHNYSGMGMGGGTGAGLSPFSNNKSVAFIGDSTFFHSGLSAVSDSIKNDQDILYVVLDNKTTAMTGHQPHPGSDRDLMGRLTFAQDAARVLRGLTYGREIPVVRVNPEKREEYRAALEDLILLPGVKFVVADKECGITYHRRKRHERAKTLADLGYLPREVRINVASDVCEYCLECTRITGCPGLTVESTMLGSKIATDLSTCVSDRACARINACPSFEELAIYRAQPAVKPALPDHSDLPLQPLKEFDGEWRAYMAGIGGMGIGATTALLVRAAQEMGYTVNFCDKKGLAIRNGGVYSHLVFTRDARVVSPVTPYGRADLILGLDLLEAARGLDPRMNLRVGSPDRTDCVTNTAKNETILSLLGRDHFDPADIEASLRKACRSWFGVDLSTQVTKYLGLSQYVNMALLGCAYQRGLLPLAIEDLTFSIRENFRPEEAERNLAAFGLGRDLVEHPERYAAEPVETLEAMVERQARRLSSASSRAYRDLFSNALMGFKLPDTERPHLALRLFELVQWGGPAYARRYLDLLLKVQERDSAAQGWAATRAVLRQAFKVMAIKDEIYVSQLLVNPDKYVADARRYNVNLAAGDRIVYKHYNRPSFNVFGKEISFHIETRDWMLRIMAHMGFLRSLLPGWHVKELAFREWYLELADTFQWQTPEQYQTWVELLNLPEEVRGYRDIRYPGMEAAHKKADELLAKLKS